VLQLDEFFGDLVDEQLDRVLIGQPVAAADRIVEVIVEAVILFHHAGRSSFRGAGVATHRIDLRQQRDLEVGVGFGDGDRRPQARSSCADDDDVRVDHLHRALPNLPLRWREV
jgi:hypothetical protein